MQIAELQQWVQARLDAPFAARSPEVRAYNDEVVIILHADDTLHVPASENPREAELQTIGEQREATRTLRMQLADELQPLLRRPIAWGMRVGSSEVLFTTRSVPVMTRLSRAERDVLDTLVAAGVAETRSSALAYVVRSFATEYAEWLAEVREAIAQVHEIRARLKITPRSGAPTEMMHTHVPQEQEQDSDEEQHDGRTEQ